MMNPIRKEEAQATLTPSQSASSDYDKDDENNSPETAGIIRGLSRSIRVFRSGVVGRLPAVRPPKLSVKRVGRLSDQASKGIDFFSFFSEAASEQESASSSRSSTIKRAAAFTLTFTTSEWLPLSFYLFKSLQKLVVPSALT
jgi:hypothetical protein